MTDDSPEGTPVTRIDIDEPETVIGGTRYTADDFEPEVVQWVPPRAEPRDPDPQAAQPPPKPKTEQPLPGRPFYGGVLNPPVLDYGGESAAQPLALLGSSREDAQRRAQAAYRLGLRRATSGAASEGVIPQPDLPSISPPAEDLIGRGISLGRTAAKVGELGDVWGALPAPVKSGTIFVQAILKTLNEIGSAHSIGDSLAARNAYRWGFAKALTAMADGESWAPTLPRNTDVGYRQRQGRNDAIRLVKGLGERDGKAFVAPYGGNSGFARALSHLGGYESSARGGRKSVGENISEVISLARTAWSIGELGAGWQTLPAPVDAGSLYVLAILKTLNEIAKAHSEGDTLAARNAYRWGFARTLAAMAERQDWHATLPVNLDVGYRQRQGRNDAIRLIKGLGERLGIDFLAPYKGNGGFARALSDLGGYESSLPVESR